MSYMEIEEQGFDLKSLSTVKMIMSDTNFDLLKL